MENETRAGVVKWYNAEKGYGFIGRDGQDDLFFHANDRVDTSWNPQEGDQVTFVDGEGRKGPVAQQVQLAGAEAATAEEDDMDME